MGITIHYRGSLTDPIRIEEMENRVIELATELGGSPQRWHSTCDHDPQRVVRGVIVTLRPGQEATSLLVSPEGWLIGLVDIEAAENGELEEPPWCFVKTQFGPVEGHVALVELLTCVKDEFIPNLDIHDEGDYYTTRDVETLRQKFTFLQAAIDGLADGLRQHGLTPEAAEDPEIVAERIQRIAKSVHQTLGRPPEQTPAPVDDDSKFKDPPNG